MTSNASREGLPRPFTPMTRRPGAAGEGGTVKGIKILGLAAFTALALTAFSSVASAAPGYFVAGSYPASVKGTATAPTGELITKEGTVLCQSPTLSGTLSNATDSLDPSVDNKFCYANPSTTYIYMNGCKFIYHPPSEGINGTVDIGGSECSGLTGSTGAAAITIPPQSGLAATFQNEGTGTGAKVKIHIQTSALKYTLTGGFNPGTYSNGTYTPTWSVAGENGGKATGVSIHAAPGFLLKSGAFQSELYPVTVGGGQIAGEIKGVEFAKLTFETGAGNAKCASMTFATSSTMKTEAGEVQLVPTYSTCTLGGVSATVTPEAGCSYRVQSNGELGTCGVEFVKATCKVTVPAQTHTGLEFVNKGTGANSYIETKTDISGLEYQVAGSGCPIEKAPGSYSDGHYRGIMKLGVIKVG